MALHLVTKGKTMNFNETLPIEAWNTRFGTSVRTVKRDSKGRFVNNKSAKQMIRVQDKANNVRFVKASS